MHWKESQLTGCWPQLKYKKILRPFFLSVCIICVIICINGKHSFFSFLLCVLIFFHIYANNEDDKSKHHIHNTRHRENIVVVVCIYKIFCVSNVCWNGLLFYLHQLPFSKVFIKGNDVSLEINDNVHNEMKKKIIFRRRLMSFAL